MPANPAPLPPAVQRLLDETLAPEAMALMAGSTVPRLNVAGFEGPLDFLIEQVRRQRVDLGPLSILVLTDQLVEAIEAEGTALERRGDWLVMVSELLLLRGLCGRPFRRKGGIDVR